jgi:hypothetical protein
MVTMTKLANLDILFKLNGTFTALKLFILFAMEMGPVGLCSA